MQPDSAALLWDAIDASRRAVSIADGLRLDEYVNQWVLQSAAERQLEIIGEALKNLRAVDPRTAERVPDVHAIIATRNILVHAYARVDHHRIWTVLTKDLPALIPVLEHLLAEAD
jgi:uncharacterized protein with HEPN domain